MWNQKCQTRKMFPKADLPNQLSHHHLENSICFLHAYSLVFLMMVYNNFVWKNVVMLMILFFRRLHVGLVWRQASKRIGNVAGITTIKLKPCILWCCTIMARVNSIHVGNLLQVLVAFILHMV